MANYSAAARSNYVTVADIPSLEKVLKKHYIDVVTNDDGKVALFDNTGEGFDNDFDFKEVVMPYINEGEVFVIVETGSFESAQLVGYAHAYIRQGKRVKTRYLQLSDIYSLAAAKFGVSVETISEAAD